MLVALALLGLGRVADAGSQLGLVADEDEGPRLLVRPARRQGRRTNGVNHQVTRDRGGGEVTGGPAAPHHVEEGIRGGGALCIGHVDGGIGNSGERHVAMVWR